MGLSLAGFLKRIEAGKGVKYCYEAAGKEGCVGILKLHDSYHVLWEECPAGEWLNEHLYTRYDQFVFARMDQLMAFLESHELSPGMFTP